MPAVTTTQHKYNVLGTGNTLTIEKYRELEAKGVNLDTWRDFHTFCDPLDAPERGCTGLGQLIMNVAALTGSQLR